MEKLFYFSISTQTFRLGSEKNCKHFDDFKSHFLRISRIERHSQNIEFFLFCQNIPLGKLIQEKIIQSSNELFNGRKFKSSKNA